MTSLAPWEIIFLLVCVAIGFLVWWGELSYLSTKAIGFLYDILAPVYELKWLFLKDAYLSKEKTYELFLRHIMENINKNSEAKVLDLGCGTGRITFLLLEQDKFKGKIFAYDISYSMLALLKWRLKRRFPTEAQDRVFTERLDLKDWKTKDSELNSVDVVVMLETSEFIPNFPELVKEISKLMKPNGLFLLTKPTESIAWSFVGRMQTREKMTELLKENHFDNIEISAWLPRYEIVRAIKK